MVGGAAQQSEQLIYTVKVRPFGDWTDYDLSWSSRFLFRFNARCHRRALSMSETCQPTMTKVAKNVISLPLFLGCFDQLSVKHLFTSGNPFYHRGRHWAFGKQQ